MPGERFVPGVGADWTPASGKTPPISLSRVQAVARSAGWERSTNASGPPETTLANYSNFVSGTIQPDGSAKSDFMHVLAWVLRYPDAHIPAHGPGATPPDVSDFYVIYDATTDTLMAAFGGGDLQIG